jgi:hypothetical protein
MFEMSWRCGGYHTWREWLSGVHTWLHMLQHITVLLDLSERAHMRLTSLTTTLPLVAVPRIAIQAIVAVGSTANATWHVEATGQVTVVTGQTGWRGNYGLRFT